MTLSLWEEGFRFLEDQGIGFSALEKESLRSDCDRFVALLLEKNAVVNLTAIRDPDDAFWKHIIDSLLLLSLEPMEGILDWGTGGGFPGIPFLLAKRAKGEVARVIFLDSVGKKVRAVEEFLGALGLLERSLCVHARGEQYLSNGDLRGVDTVVMRAVAPTDRAKNWISVPSPLRRWVLFLGPQQLDLWLKEESFLGKKGLVFGRQKTFLLPNQIGQRIFLEIQKK